MDLNIAGAWIETASERGYGALIGSLPMQQNTQKDIYIWFDIILMIIYI
jgi:hypothetical protein